MCLLNAVARFKRIQSRILIWVIFIVVYLEVSTVGGGGGENTFFSVTLYNFQLKYRHKCIRIFNNDS